MNLAKGFKRLTLVLSFLAGPLVFFLICIIEGGDPLGEGFLVFLFVLSSLEVIGFAAVWIIYLVMRWIVKGFRENEQKDEQKE